MSDHVTVMSVDKEKIFNDPIHGTIQLHPLLVKIIDTPEFQRLRHIKQMGCSYYIYPGAQHNRFEHSIGTAHLAGKLVRHLKKLQEDEEKNKKGKIGGGEGEDKDQELKSKMKINDKDVLCVEIAGLCHDLGHGPFSHVFDGKFMKGKLESEWKHEQSSCKMFDRILKTIKKDIDEYNEKCRDEDPKLMLINDDFKFIKEMINGHLPGQSECTGRGKSKSFLYEIISNKTSGVDVDKWDYFARDCHHLGIKTGFDHDRFIKCTRVIEVEEADHQMRNRICVRDKEVFNLYEMFHTRFVLHKRACQHPVVHSVEHVICDALSAANDYILIPGDFKDPENQTPAERKTCKISECVAADNLSSFCNLDDRILLTIQNSMDNELKKSQEILKRLSTRKLYECVGNEILGNPDYKLDDDVIKSEIAGGNDAMKKQLRVTIVKFNYGSGDKDPIQNYRFYKKDEETKAIKIEREEVSFLLPDVFEETVVHVFCISEKKDEIEKAKTAFKTWYEDHKPATTRKPSEKTGNLAKL